MNYGPLVTGADIEEAVIAHLRLWMEDKLAAVERSHDLSPRFIKTPERYTSRNEFDKLPDENLPLIVVVAPGLVGEPEKDGTQSYTAPYGVGIAAVVSAPDKESVNRLAKFYTRAITAAMLHNPSIGGIARDTRWTDERYDDVPSEDEERSLKAAQVVFRLDVPNVVQAMVGPSEPPEDPYDLPDPGPGGPNEVNVSTDWLEEEL